MTPSLSWTLASGYFPQHYPDLPVAAYWLKGMIAALFLFGSILVHELMHAITAQKLHVPIAGITPFALGGVAEMKGEPPSPSAEFKIAIVGARSRAWCWQGCSGCCGGCWTQRAGW